MKKIIFFLVFAVLTHTYTHAQVKKPTKWTTSITEKQVKIGDEIELIFTANIDQNWYIYTASEKEGGPILVKIDFKKNATFQLLGNIVLPTNGVEKYDDIFEMKVMTAKKQAIFKQKIKILDKNPIIKSNISFQTCNLTAGLCVNSNEDANFNIIVIK